VGRRSSDNISTQASKHHKILRKAYTTCLLIWEEGGGVGFREKEEKNSQRKPRERKNN
jgi:hypothetical protein